MNIIGTEHGKNSRKKEFWMKNKIKVFWIASFIAVFAFTMAACFGQSGGGKIVDNAEELKTYLDSQPANSPDKPIKVTMNANEQTIGKIAEVIKSTDKYVSFTISGNGLTSIPDFAFAGCTSLTSITIPNSVTEIEDSAFFNCTSLTAINVSTGNTTYSSNDGVLYNKNKTELIKYPEGKTTSSFSIPNGVTRIGDEAFNDCTSLTSVNIPNSVTEIGDWAFSNCTSLSNVTIGNGVTEIGNRAFIECRSLTSITIPNSVNTIREGAFGKGGMEGWGIRYTYLTSVTIGTDVEFYYLGDSIGSGFESVYINGGRRAGTYTRPNNESETWTKQ
jgi:hypothetical protein